LQRGVRGDQGEATRGLGRAGAPSEDALTIAELEEEGHPIVHTAPVTAATQEPSLGDSPPCATPLRSGSHREWRTRAPVMAYSGEPPTKAGCTVTVASPLPAESPRAIHPYVSD
jgi:hypothetical protein